MKNLTRQNPGQLFVAQELINKVKSKCCGIKDNIDRKIEINRAINQNLPILDHSLRAVEVRRAA